MKYYFWGILVMLVVWQVLSLFVGRIFLPSPAAVFQELFELSASRELYLDIWMTFKRTIIGLSLGAFIGIILGTILGSFSILYRYFRLPLDFVRSIPATALFPLFIVLLGLGEAVKIFVAAWAACLIILVNTYYGLQNVLEARRLLARLKNFSFIKTAILITIPSALPYVAAGLRVSLSFALIVELVAEMFLGSQNGLGHRIFAASSVLAMEEVYVGIILIGALGYLLNSLMILAEQKIIHWSGKSA